MVVVKQNFTKTDDMRVWSEFAVKLIAIWMNGQHSTAYIDVQQIHTVYNTKMLIMCFKK